MKRWVGLLGLAARAGKVASGAAAVEESMRRGRARLVLLAGDGSRRWITETENHCRKRKIPVFFVDSKNFLGDVLGRSPRSAAAILDDRLGRETAAAIQEEFSSRMGETRVSGYEQTGQDLSVGEGTRCGIKGDPTPAQREDEH